MRTLALLFALPSLVLASPPDLSKFPDTVKPEGQFATYVPDDKEIVSVTYVALDGVESLPSHLLNDKRTFLLDCYGKPVKTYRFVAVASNKTGEQSRKTFTVPVGPAPTPVPPAPVPVPEDGRLGMVKVSRDGYAQVMRSEGRASVKANAETFASQIAAGAYRPHESDAQVRLLFKDWADSNAKILASDVTLYDAWLKWADPVGKGMYNLYTAKKLTTKQDWVDAFRETAQGLE